jgi:hypothetical protein
MGKLPRCWRFNIVRPQARRISLWIRCRHICWRVMSTPAHPTALSAGLCNLRFHPKPFCSFRYLLIIQQRANMSWFLRTSHVILNPIRIIAMRNAERSFQCITTLSPTFICCAIDDTLPRCRLAGGRPCSIFPTCGLFIVSKLVRRFAVPPHHV